MTEKETEYTCPKCQARGQLKRVYSRRREKWYWVCQTAESECGAWYPDDGGRPKLPPRKSPPSADMPCPTCAAPMQRVQASTYDFYSCSKYPACTTTIDCLPDGRPAPLCPHNEEHGHMRLRSGVNGKFWSCRAWKEAGCAATLEIDGKPSRKKSSAL
jgi:ssDNA-binding Zn-finger/Zn-ribbon topoisomerase 1